MGRKDSAMKRKMPKGFVRGLIPIALVLMLSLWPEGALTATFNVSDGDVAGLIAAINTANANGVADTINLAPGGTYTLTAVNNADNGLPIITSEITINGNGATIERSSVAGTPDFRIIYIAGPNAGDLTLNEVSIKGGRLFASGAGIQNFGTLKVIDGLVTGNRGDGGAGIYNRGVVELINSTVSGNIDRFFGAGIWNDGAYLTLINSSITGNSGRLRGTGLQNDAGNATLINSTVSGNTNGAGIGNMEGTLTLINSTISGNTPHPTEGGGGITNSRFGTVTLVNSTVTGNTNISGAGGVINAGSNEVMRLKNTIVANNGPADCFGVITTLGHNIVSDASCGLTGSGDLNTTDPLLGPLAGNGGPTETHALLPGSPAIDAVPLADCTDANGNPVATDQRGVTRPQGTACDIGAYEVEAEITVAIDIKPGSFPNSINPKSKGVIPVAILTTGAFDATTVDPTTVLFGATGTETVPVHSALEDVDGDGDTDMILHFNTQDTGILCGDTAASLTGETFGGVAIKGSDSIKTVGCK
jgi:hypothetical protein